MNGLRAGHDLKYANTKTELPSKHRVGPSQGLDAARPSGMAAGRPSGMLAAGRPSRTGAPRDAAPPLASAAYPSGWTSK